MAIRDIFDRLNKVYLINYKKWLSDSAEQAVIKNQPRRNSVTNIPMTTTFHVMQKKQGTRLADNVVKLRLTRLRNIRD
jgi:hypothetical protein